MSKQIDWEMLKLQFMMSGEKSPRTFLIKEKGWPESRCDCQNTYTYINSWKEEKARKRKEIIENEMAELNRIESERLPVYKIAKLNLMSSVIERIHQNKVICIRELWMIYRILKIELNEPIKIAISKSNDFDDAGLSELREQVRELIDDCGK